ncbi:MAG: hypothetical protein ACLUKN_16465 [Bacilli bacterium]
MTRKHARCTVCGMYISCLLNANRLIEAKTLVLAMPIKIPPSLLSSVMFVAEHWLKRGCKRSFGDYR